MFEWACRIGQELQGLPALRQQTSCLAAVLSCLRLVDVGGAWVVRPGDPCAVVDLQGVSREFVLARCRLGLAKHCPSLSEPVHCESVHNHHTRGGLPFNSLQLLATSAQICHAMPPRRCQPW